MENETSAAACQGLLPIDSFILCSVNNVTKASQLIVLALRNMHDECSCSLVYNIKQREIYLYLDANMQAEYV